MCLALGRPGGVRSQGRRALLEGRGVAERDSAGCALASPHTLSYVTSGEIPNRSEPDCNVSAPSPDLEAVITAAALQFTEGERERSRRYTDKETMAYMQ